MVADARHAGLPVTADVGICHLHLTEDDAANYDPDCHLRPPLRGTSDRDALRQAVTDGIVDAVCSDHFPHDEDAKSAPFVQTEPGASTIELLLPLMAALVDTGTLPITRAIAAVTTGPASILGLTASGTLAVGAAADIAVFGPNDANPVTGESLRSSGKNCPFKGRTLSGRVRHTLYSGRIVHTA